MIAPSRRTVLALVAVLAVAAYFRLWNVVHTFNLIHDFDEGAYAIGARAMLGGYLPYRDFILIHPPLYNILLAGAYQLLGYDFLLGRFLSIACSVGCVAVLYLLGRRLYDSRAGIVAAAFFACSGMVVYLGRRGVQDSLGLLLVLLGVLLALRYLETTNKKHLFFSGLLFGLAVATKYLFLPLVLGVVGATLLCSGPSDAWKGMRRLVEPGFWMRYAAVSLCFFALVLLVRRLALLPLPVPLLDPLYPVPLGLLIVTMVFVLPIPCALALLGIRPRRHWLEREVPLWISGRKLASMLLGAMVGFSVVVAPFFVRAPAEYVQQTFLLHQQRNIAEVPSFLGILRTLPLSDTSLLLTAVPMLCVIPAVVLLLRRSTLTRGDAFVALVLATAFLLCQVFPPMPRYYICVYPMVFLGLSRLVVWPEPATPGRARQVAYVAVCLLFLLSLVSSVDILRRYSPDGVVRGGRLYTPDERVYAETSSYLRTAGARKVYAVNPAFMAMAEGTPGSIRADSLAELFLEGRPPQDMLADLWAEGVDHIVLDPWLTYWGDSWPEARQFADAVRAEARLVRTIDYGSNDHVEIYRLGAEPESLFNGDFVLWDRYLGNSYPAGWQPVIVESGMDSASIGRFYDSGRQGVALTVFESGIVEDDTAGTHAGILQEIAFPEGLLFVEVRCSELTEVVGVGARGPAIHFLDGAGHSLVVGFSDSVAQERSYPCDACDQSLVMQPCRPHEWQFYSLNLRRLWAQTGWPEPSTLRLLFVVSAADDYPGYYEFFVSGVYGD